VTTPEIANVVTIVGLIAASFLISYLIAQHTVRQARENARAQLELRLGGLTSAIADLEARVSELSAAIAAISAPAANPQAPGIADESAAAIADGGTSAPPVNQDAEVSTEVLILISAAVTAFLGKKVRIRSAKMLQSPYEIVNPWAQQGRVIMQASHNLQVRR
jgi:methylmalonyl-CoA carboxyltransferase large subunit